MEQEEEVMVKVEDEMGIFVKEEESFIGETSTSVYDEDASIDISDLLVAPRPQYPNIEEFQRQLLVYTKKLDDMRVWKKLHKYSNPKEILQMTIAESKPDYPGKYKKKRKRRNLIKYLKFISNLEIYKEKFANKGRTLMKNCYQQQKNAKRSNVKVKNVKRKRDIQIINVDDYSDDSNDNNDSDDSGANSDGTIFILTQNNTSVITVDDDETDISSTPIVETNIAPAVAVDIQTLSEHLTPGCYILIIHTLRSLCDVYLVNESGIPTEYYRIDEKCLKNISDPKSVTIRRNCCWFTRHLNLREKVMNLENSSSILNAFTRKPHSCDVENCLCCCKRKYERIFQFPTSRSFQPTEKSYVKNRWHLRLISQHAQQNQNSLINAAIVHKPKIKPFKEKGNKKDCMDFVCLKLNCNKNRTHVYYIGKNGLINIYIRPNNFCTSEYYQDVLGPCLSLLPGENICCLAEYKNYCLKLVKKVHPTVVKFLSNSLVYESNKCDTCVNKEIQNVSAKEEVGSSYLPKYPRHTKPYLKVTIRRNTPFYNSTIKTFIERAMDKSKNASLNKTKTTLDLRCKDATTSIASKTSEINASNLINLGIRDLRLIIYPGGKVKIMSTTSPDEISTENLQILREIIQHAQNKVQSQCFNPSRLINVNNLFEEKQSTQKYQNNETTKDSGHILRTILNSTEKTRNHHDVSKDLESNKMVTHPTTNKVNAKEPVSNFTKQDKNFYQVLKNINVEKRKQYLISHDFLRDADANLWENVNVYNTKENMKRKTAEKGTSPPPKQICKQSIDQTIVSEVSMVSTSTRFLPTLPTKIPNVSFETKRRTQPTTRLPTSNVPLQNIVSTESVHQIQVPNSSFSLPHNVTLIPIGQLPQEFVRSLYEKYAMLPKTPQSLTIAAQPLHLINATQHLSQTNSLLDNSNIQSSVPTNAVIPSNEPHSESQLVQYRPAVNFKNDDSDANDDDCILGV